MTDRLRGKGLSSRGLVLRSEINQILLMSYILILLVLKV